MDDLRRELIARAGRAKAALITSTGRAAAHGLMASILSRVRNHHAWTVAAPLVPGKPAPLSLEQEPPVGPSLAALQALVAELEAAAGLTPPAAPSMPGKPDMCRSCKAEIVWMETAQGRPMPCDPPVITVRPVSLGGFALGDLVTGLSATGEIVAGVFDPEGTPVRVSHFATCPNASQHRQTRPARSPAGGRSR